MRVAVTVHPPQQKPFDQGAKDGNGDRCQHQGQPEVRQPSDRVAEVRTQHIEGAVREIEDAHHTEDERQPC